MGIVTTVVLIVTHWSSLVSSQHQRNSTCQLRDTCDKSNTSVINCVFPGSILFFHVSISKEPENSPEIIITCSPCQMAEKFENLITLKFPETLTQGETWSFEVKRSPESVGSYTCYGFQGPASLHTTQCNITRTFRECSPQIAEENNSPDSSSEMLPLISIPVVILVVILVLLVWCRRRIVKDRRQSLKVSGDQNHLPLSTESLPLKIQDSGDHNPKGDGLAKITCLSRIDSHVPNGGTRC